HALAREDKLVSSRARHGVAISWRTLLSLPSASGLLRAGALAMTGRLPSPSLKQALRKARSLWF
ncbi:MAG: hypothetical protein ACXWCW_26855, partial [Burkholderiales bacterium]